MSSRDDGIFEETYLSSAFDESITANLKRSASSQDLSERASCEVTVSKKIKKSRGIVSMVTEKPAPSSPLSTSSSNYHSDSILSGSPGQDMAYLLEELDEVEGDGILQVASP